MGVCQSACAGNDTGAEEVQNDKSSRLSADIAAKMKNENQIYKLLLLGAGESGKSTLFKQLVSLYSKSPTENDAKHQTELIHANIIENAKALEEASHINPAWEATSEDGIAACEFISELEGNQFVDCDVCVQLESFWGDEGIQVAFANRSNFQLGDSTSYFFSKLDEIVSGDWVPGHDDRIRTRVRTTGIVEHNFEIDNNKFKMFDVGGQRNERKKWIHCFENVTCVMFVAAISEFDQKLYEDEDTNRMVEALALFQDIVNSKWFKETAVILFLNKEDLFREKIVNKDITDSDCVELKDFTGDCRSFEETTHFLEQVFLKKKIPDDTSNAIICHVVCATKTAMVKLVFDNVKKIIIDDLMKNVL